MNIEKTQSCIKIKNSINMFLDPVKVLDGGVNIITDASKNINYDRVFNLPGDYELNGIMIKGFSGEKYSFLIKDDASILYFVNSLPQKALEEIFESYGEIDCIIAPEVNKPEMYIEKIGVKMFITFNKPLKISGLAFEKTHLVKINPKKITKTSYFLE